jgi:hypothetical protein
MATKIEIYGGRGSGKSRLAERMSRAGISMREDSVAYDEADRHVFVSSARPLTVEQWLRANDFPAERKSGAIVVRLAAKHSQRLTSQEGI